MKIFLNEKSFKRLSDVNALVENEISYNPNFNGAQAMYFASDFNYIEDCEEIDGAFLMHKINDLLEQ